jgi:hypothetical protein
MKVSHQKIKQGDWGRLRGNRWICLSNRLMNTISFVPIASIRLEIKCVCLLNGLLFIKLIND